MLLNIELPDDQIKGMLTAVPLSRETMMVMQYGETMTKDRACEVLGVSPTTIWRLIKDKKIKTCMSGMKLDTRSIARFLEEE